MRQEASRSAVYLPDPNVLTTYDRLQMRWSLEAALLWDQAKEALQDAVNLPLKATTLIIH